MDNEEQPSVLGVVPALAGGWVDDQGTVSGSPASAPDPEVVAKLARPKRYSVAYKVRILAAADACTAPGDVVALCRREGIYHSTLADFRKQQARGLFGPNPPARPTSAPSIREQELLKQVASMEREARKLRRQVHRSGIIIEFQKKVHEMFGIANAAMEPFEED